MSKYSLLERRQRLASGLRRDTGHSILDQDFRPDDILEVEEAQARPEASSYGPSFPFGPSDVHTISAVTSFKEQLEMDITSLLLTSPGEAVGDPDFGVGARQFLFESSNNSASDAALISRIQNQMEEYYSSVKILNLRVFTVEDTKHVELVVSVGGTTVSVTV